MYDDKGNLEISAEQIINSLSTKLAQKELEATQLQIAVEMLSKELQDLKGVEKDLRPTVEVVKK